MTKPASKALQAHKQDEDEDDETLLLLGVVQLVLPVGVGVGGQARAFVRVDVSVCLAVQRRLNAYSLVHNTHKSQGAQTESPWRPRPACGGQGSGGLQRLPLTASTESLPPSAARHHHEQHC